MPETHLSVLRAGLTKLRELTNTRKNELLAQLQNQEKISSVDKEWLDNEGNLVDEEAVVSLLETASDYESGLVQLSSQQKILVEKLIKLGGGTQLPAKKRKSA
jgi:hypothetical protein